MGAARYFSYGGKKLLTSFLPLSYTLLSIKTFYYFARVYTLPTIMKIFNKTTYEQDKQCKCKHNVEERPRKPCHVGKVVCYIY